MKVSVLSMKRINHCWVRHKEGRERVAERNLSADFPYVADKRGIVVVLFRSDAQAKARSQRITQTAGDGRHVKAENTACHYHRGSGELVGRQHGFIRR